MKIAVLSGKGGTGKTLVSVNLAAAAETARYIDCDVEEPNGHLFFKPKTIFEEEVSVMIPAVQANKCTCCRRCVEFCKFNALAHTQKKLIIFEDICHSCGGCILVCPEEALTESSKVIGSVQMGLADKKEVWTGILNTGEATGVPIIKRLLEENEKLPEKQTFIFIDCPPGSACVVMESIKDADYCILVAEPTLFGVHNLAMVYELVVLFKKPFGVVLNKYLDDDNPVMNFCREKGIKLLSKIPFDNKLGKINSNAEIAVYKDKEYRKLFLELLRKVTEEVRHEAAANS